MRMWSIKCVHYQWEPKVGQPLWKTAWLMLTKLDVLLSHGPVIIFLSIHSDQLQAFIYRKSSHVYVCFIHNYLYLEATKMPPNKWINKLWCILTMKYYSALKRNELSSNKRAGRDCKHILINRRIQPVKVTYYIINYNCTVLCSVVVRLRWKWGY